MTFLIALAHDGNLDYADIAEASWSEYARKHGYDFTVRRFTPQHHGNGHPSWQKLGLLQRLIEGATHDWILWADTDTVVTNFHYWLDHPIASRFYEWKTVDGITTPIHFPPDPNAWMIVSKDWNDYSPWSAGVMLVKSCDDALAFLREAETHTEYRDAGTWDQDAMHDVWRAKGDGIRIIPRRILQSVPSDVVQANEPWEQGDFLCHATGVPNSQKRRHLLKYASLAIR